jgi:hypothetical protein
MNSPKHPPVAYVEWVDTATISAHWQDREEALKQADGFLAPITAAGFLLADEECGIILSLLYNDHNDDAGHVVVIPRLAVRKLVVTRPGKGFKREPGRTER